MNLKLILTALIALNCVEKTPIQLLKSENAMERIEASRMIKQKIYQTNGSMNDQELKLLEAELKELRSDSESWHRRVLAAELNDLVKRKISNEPFPKDDSEIIFTAFPAGGKENEAFLQRLADAQNQSASSEWKPVDQSALKQTLERQGLIAVKMNGQIQFLVGARMSENPLAKERSVKTMIFFDQSTKQFSEIAFGDSKLNGIQILKKEEKLSLGISPMDHLFMPAGATIEKTSTQQM